MQNLKWLHDHWGPVLLLAELSTNVDSTHMQKIVSIHSKSCSATHMSHNLKFQRIIRMCKKLYIAAVTTVNVHIMLPVIGLNLCISLVLLHCGLIGFFLCWTFKIFILLIFNAFYCSTRILKICGSHIPTAKETCIQIAILMCNIYAIIDSLIIIYVGLILIGNLEPW